uniref:Uncharacterized protein n=1 Tax=Polyblepharides amylifera TaxID=1486889 RepID=A0A7R9SVL3_9CHLO|mmetsp:Transcript_65/g.89  ORF Transcript_65/g.89 Transcript_65/m.89 type:complete len:184 (+) Transcript_65:125-676(+)|eukprot:CAMPEP_0196571604 /NCGR_PEP_ID=MMETSP1081-20130531/1755_1 /TAXON_ID=36882 /ORGANISM="Pyramimonas amylifera, Strain CCMP720" /LENGTH=183 /DNA_ID=CAMNT_0041888621 /DNA_START=113 /DNA_END=664 /DNA_ORIENTATION=+
MASFAVSKASFMAGAALKKPSLSQARVSRVQPRTVALVEKKIISYDNEWSKDFFTTGLFVEDNEKQEANYLKKIEEKSLLSSIEGLGLLTFADKNGITLSKIEKWGLLSKAEELGALSLIEKLLMTEGALITGASLPCFIGAILAFGIVPDDIALVKWLLVDSFLALGGALFIGGFVVSTINE